MISNTFNIDCVEYMKLVPPKFFDLAIVDPPYGLSDLKKNKNSRHKTNDDTTYKNDSIPGAEYFIELSRVSKNTIIWGCQYMIPFLNSGGSFIIWDKGADPDMHNMSSCDVAWYSNRQRIRKFKGHWCGAVKCEMEPTIHPHQKPVSLYRWLLKHYAKPEYKILDTHMGSQSSRLAAYDMGYDYWGCELDPYYFKKGEERFEVFRAQLKITTI